MHRDGHTPDQIDTVDTYRQAACTTLADNPTLKTNWNATTVKTEILDSYNITLGDDAVAAILASCK